MLKLPGHKRYDYLPITKRQHYSWPGGKRLAFYIALNIEHFAFQAGLGMDPHNRTGTQQTSRNFAWRDYGNRVGNWRFFEMLDELKLPPRSFSIRRFATSIRKSSKRLSSVATTCSVTDALTQNFSAVCGKKTSVASFRNAST